MRYSRAIVMDYADLNKALEDFFGYPFHVESLIWTSEKYVAPVEFFFDKNYDEEFNPDFYNNFEEEEIVARNKVREFLRFKFPDEGEIVLF